MGAVNLVHSENLAEIAAGRTTARDTAELYAGYATQCAGDCGKKVITPALFHELNKRAQRVLSDFDVRIEHEFGACRRCVVKVRESLAPKKPTAQEKAAEKRAQVTELWNRVRSEGGGRKHLAEALGVTRQAVDYLIRKYDLPVEHTATERARIFEEELQFLLSCGLGVHEIAQRLGITADALVRKVDVLRGKHLTDVHFENYNYNYRSREAA